LSTRAKLHKTLFNKTYRNYIANKQQVTKLYCQNNDMVILDTVLYIDTTSRSWII
jgi:DNA-binding LytR/AlgR family response regulator